MLRFINGIQVHPNWVQLGNTFTGDAGSRFGSSVSLNKDGTMVRGHLVMMIMVLILGKQRYISGMVLLGLKEEVILMELQIMIIVATMLELIQMEPD